MRIVPASYEILYAPYDAEERIERAGRTCYRSEDRITPGSAAKFCRTITHQGHESVLEHVSISVRFIVDRGVSHELVRHRLASFSQESTRYVDYDECTFVRPPLRGEAAANWEQAMQCAADAYRSLRSMGVPPELARDVLPNSLATAIVVTANVREWRHILRLRTSLKAHPQIREVMCPLLDDLISRHPALFSDVKI